RPQRRLPVAGAEQRAGRRAPHAARHRRTLRAAPASHHGRRRRSSLRCQARRRPGQPVGTGRPIGNAVRPRRRLPEARPGARGVCVRAGRVEWTECGARHRKRVPRHRSGPGIPDRLGSAGGEPDLLLLPGNILTRAAQVAGVVAVAATACVGGAAAQQQQPSPTAFVRPLASLLIPGTGQLMANQDRGAVYLAAEVYLVSRFLQLDHEATREAQHFQDLAFDVARRDYGPMRRDTVFEYYEQMERFAESGAYDADPSGAFVPEADTATYNGAVWRLARRTFWEDPDVPPDPTSPQYWRAVQFYQSRAVGPNFQWSWRDHSLEREVYRDYIKRSDAAFRRAPNQNRPLLAHPPPRPLVALIPAPLT